MVGVKLWSKQEEEGLSLTWEQVKHAMEQVEEEFFGLTCEQMEEAISKNGAESRVSREK